MDISVENTKALLLSELDELERDIKILSERIERAREDIALIECEEDIEEFRDKCNFEEGLVHIEIF